MENSIRGINISNFFMLISFLCFSFVRMFHISIIRFILIENEEFMFFILLINFFRWTHAQIKLTYTSTHKQKQKHQYRFENMQTFSYSAYIYIEEMNGWPKEHKHIQHTNKYIFIAIEHFHLYTFVRRREF